MTCEQCERQLNALADGALPPLRAWQIRRHMAQCPACTTAYAQIVQMGSEARAWRSAAPPAALAVRITLALPPQTAQMENAAMILERPQPVAVPPRRIAARKARIALALAACFAVVLTLTLWPGRQATLPATYADTVAAMQRVRSASWVETDTVTNPQGHVTQRRVEQTWVRRNPPAIATRVLPDPAVPGSGYRSLTTPRGFWQQGHDSNPIDIDATVTRLTKQVQKRVELAPIAGRVRGAMQPLIPSGFGKRGSGPQWKQEQTTLNGQTVTRIRQQFTAHYPAKAHQVLRGPVTYWATVWVNPRSHRVQRRALQMFGSLTGHVDFITDHFVYDQSAPAGVFDEAAYPANSFHAPAILPHKP